MADYERFDRLIEREYKTAKLCCRKTANSGGRLLREPDFEDVFHRALIVARESFRAEDLDSNEGNFIGYVNRCFYYELRNYWRVNSRRRERNLDPESFILDRQEKESKQRQQRLETANRLYDRVQKMNPIYSQPLLMHYVDGKEVEEIARTLNRKPQTIYNNLQKARDELRRTFSLRAA